MRILSVVNWLNRGGIETMLHGLVPRLQALGVDVDVCSLGPGTLDAAFVARGCTLWRIPKTANCLRTAELFQRVLVRRRYDLVHSHLGHVSGGFALGAARLGIPVVVSLHSATPTSLYQWRGVPLLSQVRRLWLSWHRRLMDRYVDVVVGHSRENIRALAPHGAENPARYRVILNGTEFPLQLPSKRDARKRLGLADGDLTLLHVGSLTAPKNHAGLLSIFQEVLRRSPAVTLVLVGDGPLRGEVARQGRQMGLEGRVRFEGAQSDCWPYYRAADVFVFPSVTEGFGNVLVESQGAGLAVVASDVPAHHESVAPSQHRFLFALPDYGAAAALVLQQTEAARAGQNPWVAAARQYVRSQFTLERMAQNLQEIYREVTTRGDCRRSLSSPGGRAQPRSAA
jgi:glycosyltransferase involved in cell wall biosynthesis